MILFEYDDEALCDFSQRIASKSVIWSELWLNEIETFLSLILSQNSPIPHNTYPQTFSIPFLSYLVSNVPFPCKNRKNKWVSASLFQEGASPLDGASGRNFREILKQDAMTDPLTTLLPSSSMLISTVPSPKTVTENMKLFTLLQKLCFIQLSIFLWICDDFGEAEAGVVGFRDAEILEGGDAGIECGHGFFKIEAAVAVLIGFFKWETRRLHCSCNRIAGCIESYNQYHNQWS